VVGNAVFVFVGIEGVVERDFDDNIFITVMIAAGIINMEPGAATSEVLASSGICCRASRAHFRASAWCLFKHLSNCLVSFSQPKKRHADKVQEINEFDAQQNRGVRVGDI
jgi:hypothetical protein